MYDEFEALDVVVVAVAQEDKDLESHGRFRQHFKPEPRFEIVADLRRADTGNYQRTSTYLIDKKGKIRYKSLRGNQLEKAVETLIAEEG